MSSLTSLAPSSTPKAWVSGTTYAVGDIVLSPVANYQRYVRAVAGAGATDPASDATNWRPLGARAIKSMQRGSFTAATATVSAVNTAKSELTLLGVLSSWGTADGTGANISLTNSTTITRAIGYGNPTVSWELTEYY